MALAVVVINGLLSLQNIHQLSTQALQVMQRVNIDWNMKYGPVHHPLTKMFHLVITLEQDLFWASQTSFSFKLDLRDSLLPSSDFLEFSICWLPFFINPLGIIFQSSVSREKIIGGAEHALLTPLEVWGDDMFCEKWAESFLTKGIMKKSDV